MRRVLNWLIVLIVVGGILAAVVYPTAAWWRDRGNVKYITVKLSKGRIETVVNSTGTIKPVRTVSVGAFTSGPIKRVFVDFNDLVTEKEQVLAEIDDRLQQAAVERDRAAVATQTAELARVESLLEQATKNLNRAIKLQKANPQFISDTEMDQFVYGKKTLEAQRSLAKAAIDQAKANLRNSEDQHNYTKIRGPKEIDPEKGVKGIVIDRKVDPGQTVAATFQTPELFTIALEMDSHVYVYASVDEADIGMIRAGKAHKLPVKFTVDAYPGELFEGVIHDIRLNSTTVQNVVTYPVVIDAPNHVVEGPKLELKLKPGMTANITFPIDAKENVTRIPVSALRFTPVKEQVHPDDRHYLEAITAGQRTASEKAVMAKSRHERIVWVQEGKLLRAVEVTLGLIDHRHAELKEVRKGTLNDDDAVVTGVEGSIGPR